MRLKISPDTFRTITIIFLLATAYLAVSKLGLSLAFAAQQVTVVWPPTGLALAAVLLLGYRVWPGIMLGAFITNITTAEPFFTALGVATGNTLEAVAGAWMMRRYSSFNTNLHRVRDVFSLLVFAALISTMIAATIGVTSLCLGGVQPWERFAFLWLLWWIGDATGALIVAPLLLVWFSRSVITQKVRVVETMALMFGLIMVCLGIFSQPPKIGIVTGHAFIYLIFPFIIWSGLRFGHRGTTLVTLVASVIAIWATVHGLGPFTGPSINQSLTLLQLFMAVVAVTGLSLSAAISERKEAEESHARLAAIVAHSEDAIIGKNLNGVITFWNAGAERLFGYSEADMLGQSINLIIPDNRRAEERYIAQRLKRSERIDHYETLRMAKNGRLIDVSLTVSPIRNAEGQIIGASSVARDITDRKQVEETLKESDRRKDEFLATLAHELRNPLAPLTNALRILERPEAAAAQRQEAREIMQRQLQQMIRLVDDLLDVSRITHGKIELRKSVLLLADAINNAVETVTPKVRESGHELVVRLPEEPVWVDADPVRLAQIFSNLLSNAVKYTPRGGQIEMTAEATEHEVAVRVRDSGIGIPDTELPRIFDMFMQVDNSIERAHGGLGVGLTLVKNLVQLHGGGIEAKSGGINQGSEFIVRLPRIPAPAAQAEQPLAPVKTPARKLKVLVVDDSPAVAKTLGWTAELLGHEVRVANDGVSAIVMAHEFAPDAILLDIGLSGMSGYEVCKKMRTDPVLNHTTFIAQTGWGQPEHRRRSREAGFHHHLVKPVDISVLEKVLSSL